MNSTASSKTKKTIIVGAGVAGLALAIRRAVAGDSVEVFEATSSPGGKIHQFKIDGFRFDGGPSLFTQPEFMDELFSLAGKNRTDYFNYQKMEESCRYFWSDDTRFTASANLEVFEKNAAEALGTPKGQIKKYLKDSAWKYDKVGRIFLDRSLHRSDSWWKKDAFAAIPGVFRYGLFSSLHKFNKNFFTHPKLVQLFDRYATYNGSDPYRTSGMMSVIPHFEHNQGTFLPDKGMYSIAQSLYELGRDLGVHYHWNQKVERILHEDQQAKGVLIDGEKLSANNVISNVDIHPTYHQLLPDLPLPRQLHREERSSSAYIFYWGISRPVHELGLHNILFSDDYREEFKAIREGRMSDDPTVYINITSKVLAGEAPDSGENWFVMINAPYHRKQNWTALQPQIKQHTLKKIQQCLGLDIQKDIAVEKVWTPLQIQQDTSSFRGALYGSASNDMMSAFNRHPNFHPKVKNLYFCGGSVHPGGGIPLCLLSAKITSGEMDRS